MDDQITHLFNASGIFTPGESKHEQKEELRSEMAENDKKPSWHDFGQNLTICSYRTAENYKDVWHQCANWCHDNKDIQLKNIEKIDGNMISKFLEHKVDEGVSLNTFRQYASAMDKMGVALEMYNNKEYSFDLKEVRALGNEKLEMPEGTRAYDNPAAIIDALSGRSELIASMQHEGGFRISEVLTLKIDNLKGDGVVGIDNTKGGLYREIQLSPETYEKLKDYLEANEGRFCGSGEIKEVADAYRADVKGAATATGQAYTGSHGLRWNYAQETYAHYIKEGYTPEQALKATSKDMGHQRTDITLHYLK